MSKNNDGQKKKRVKDPVAEQDIWKESIKKENDSYKVYENFTINPSKQKPNNNIMLMKQLRKSGANPSIFNDIDQQVESPALEPQLQSKLEAIHFTPSQKYQYPQTSSQELGWHQKDKQKNASPSKFTYPRKLCNETNYANDYFTMLKVSPYSNKFK